MLLELGHSVGERISISDLTCSRAIAAVHFFENMISARWLWESFTINACFISSHLQIRWEDDHQFNFSLKSKPKKKKKNLSRNSEFCLFWAKSSEMNHTFGQNCSKEDRPWFPSKDFSEQLVPFSLGDGSCSLLRAFRKGKCVWDFNSSNLMQKPSAGTSVLCGWKDSPPSHCTWNRWQGSCRERFSSMLLILFEYFPALGLKRRWHLDAFLNDYSESSWPCNS